jgi:hypothetical protein
MMKENNENFISQVEEAAQEAWLDPKEVILPAQLTREVFEFALLENNYRVLEGIYEPTVKDGFDVAQQFLLSLAFPLSQGEEETHLSLTESERKFAREMMDQRVLDSESMEEYFSNHACAMALLQAFEGQQEQQEEVPKPKGLLRRLKEGLTQRIEW